jgi:hypothetical protein
MYIEYKGAELAGPGRIGRVRFSDSGKSIYYKGKAFQSLKGRGYKANYFEIKTGAYYWISGCKRSGGDTLYPGKIEIDEDAREEYWLDIRKCPERLKETSIRSEGKYTKRKP